MPNRVIRESLLESERYHSISNDSARLLFVEILLLADDYGLCPAHALFLRRRTSVAHSKGEEQIAKLLSELADADLVRVYMHAYRRFLFVPRFRHGGNKGRVARSPKWPLPNDAASLKEINDLQKIRSADALPPQGRRTAAAGRRTPDAKY